MEDQFGGDPQVQYLRRVFAQIEKGQGELLERLGVSPSDYRLRRVREGTLRLFEKAWTEAARRGDLALKEDEIAILYLHCLARILAGNRIAVPAGAVPRHEKIEAFLKGVFS